MRDVALVTALLLAVCAGNAAAQRDTAAVPASAVPPSSHAARSPEYTVKGHAVRLVVEDEKCIVEHRSVGTEIGRLRLDLHPPCHLLIWQKLPPRKGRSTGVSDGVPVGTLGDPMAWQYRGAEAVVALAVIGDPAPQELRMSSLYRLRERQGMRCASSVQAILIRADQARLSEKRQHIGIICVESGLEEKDFWILVHP